MQDQPSAKEQNQPLKNRHKICKSTLAQRGTFVKLQGNWSSDSIRQDPQISGVEFYLSEWQGNVALH